MELIKDSLMFDLKTGKREWDYILGV
jgi:hypothetical protein